ncbi:MAG: hypothetical protein U0M06_04725 [Clostridia bacterium]|nr:hypothetical protein [Clostridia bacterium]
MSFSENVKAELAAQREKLTCCRKAFVYGLLINSQIKESEICFETEQTEVLSVAETAFGEQFGKEPQRSEKNRFGHTRYCLSFKSNSVRDTFGGLAEAEKFSSLIGFRCENCRVHFLKGVFLSAANVSDPMKAYHLEFCIKNALSAKLLFEEFREAGFVPKIANRKNCIGLYFKESGAIEDILVHQKCFLSA